MIGSIRKHSKWLWGIIIVVVIASFVAWGTNRNNSGPTAAANYGSLGGKPITRDAVLKAQNEARLKYFFQYGEFPDRDARGFDLEQETYLRLVSIHELEDLGVHVSDETVAQTAVQILKNYGGRGELSLDTFNKQILAPHGLTTEDFEQFVRHDLGMQQLANVAGLAGKLVTPQEGRMLYEREHEELAASAVFFSGSNYVNQVTNTPEIVEKFYNSDKSRYLVPERIQINYVEFNLSNYLAAAQADLMKTNLDALVDANFERFGSNYWIGTNSAQARTVPEAKEKIRGELFRAQAVTMARKKAIEFTTALSKIEPTKVENLDQIAATTGMTVKTTEPFSEEAGPKDIQVGGDFVRRAFMRTADEPLDGPLLGEHSVFVIALKKRIPEETPTLDKVRDQVAADSRANEARNLARTEAIQFYLAVTNGLAEGKTFEALAASHNVKPVELKPFSLTTRDIPEVEPHISLNQFKQLAFSSVPGKASIMPLTPDGATVLLVKARLPIDETKFKTDFTNFMTLVRQARMGESFQGWFSRVAQRSLGGMPTSERRQAPSAPGAPTK